MTKPASTQSSGDVKTFRWRPHERVLLALAAGVFLAFSFTTSYGENWLARIAIPGALIVSILGLLAVRPRRTRFATLIVPLCAATILGAAVVANALADSTPNLLSFAASCGLLAPFLSVLAPSRRSAIVSLAAMTAIVVSGALLIASKGQSSNTVTAVVLLCGSVALAFGIIHALDSARREALALRVELERRATSDEITGVSNRAHVSVLAQNEFARSRRYGEPFTCLTIEIDGYHGLLKSHGPSALITVVQVFTGYCVVVMRHCDSFGRLASERFLALLPETPAAGAQTLATRMCRDLASLDVASGGQKLRFTVSIGIAEMHPVDRSAGDMLRRGEQGLADARERGGNCAVLAYVPASGPLEDAATAMDESSTA